MTHRQDAGDPADREPGAVDGGSGAAAPGDGSASDDAAALGNAAAESGHPAAGESARAGGRGPAQHGAHRSVGRSIVSGFGELLLTLGVVLLLLVVYEVYVTDLFGARKQAAATEVLDEKWADAGTAEVTVAGSGAAPTTGATAAIDPKKQEVDPSKRTKKYSTELGEGFAKLYIPSFGTDWRFTVIEGTDSDDLYTGPGHYSDSQYPGQAGNFAVAGHRVSKGSPFNDLDLLNACDSIVVETQDDWFVYRVLPMQDQVAGWDASKHPHCQGVSAQTGAYANTFGRTIVLPSDYAVVHPVPGSSSAAVPKKAERLITLTTCHPQFSDRERMIIHGVLVKNYAKAPGFLPPEMSAES